MLRIELSSLHLRSSSRTARYSALGCTFAPLCPCGTLRARKAGCAQEPPSWKRFSLARNLVCLYCRTHAHIRVGARLMSSNHLLQSTQSHPSNPKWRHPIERVQQRKYAWVWRRMPAFLLRFLTVLLRFGYALRLAGDSFRGHTQTLLARKHWGVDLGPLFECSPDGCLVHDKRTDARNCGMQELVLAHPWANMVDMQIYLEGFDKGEQFVLSSLCKRGPEPDEATP
jgi:hypothetical protein